MDQLTHPAGLEGAPLFFGIEVEGKYRGLRTAFVRRGLAAADFQKLLDGLCDCDQVFLTESFFAWEWLEKELLPSLHQKLMVTIARHACDVPDFFSRKVSERIRLMVRYLDVPWYRRLRMDDEVTLGVPYNLVTFAVDQGVITIAHDYEKDRAP
jgi:hypothetical protein